MQITVTRAKGSESIIHRLSPTTKGIAVLLFWGIAIFSFNPLVLIAIILVALTLWVLARISLQAIKPMLMLTAMIFIIFSVVNGFLFYGGKTVLFRFLGYPFWLEGLLFGARTSLKILAVVTIIPVLTQTTPMPLFMAALSKTRLPYKIVFTLGLAFRFIPLVTLSYKDIMDAQSLRGHDIDEMNIIQKIYKGYIPLFIPLILTLLRRSVDLDIAIESRGFGANAERSSLNDIKMKLLDWIFLLLFLIVFAGVIYLLLFGGGISWFELIRGD